MCIRDSSISYEKDPNDITKATELYLTDLNSEYIKDSKEDLKSISDGIRGHKGDVNLNIGEVMHFNNDSYDDCSEKITETIKQSYKNHATNYAAAILQGKNFAPNEFTNEEIELIQEKIAESLGFELVDHRLELYGRPKSTTK